MNTLDDGVPSTANLLDDKPNIICMVSDFSGEDRRTRVVIESMEERRAYISLGSSLSDTWPPPDLTVPWKILSQIASEGISFWLLFLINIFEIPVTVSCGFGPGQKVYTHILLPSVPL